MGKMKLKKMKTLDVQWGKPKMPDDVKEFFFDLYNLCNDVWVEYTVGMSSEDMENDEMSILDDWLLKNTDVEMEEQILLSYWW